MENELLPDARDYMEITSKKPLLKLTFLVKTLFLNILSESHMYLKTVFAVLYNHDLAFLELDIPLKLSICNSS